MYRFTACLALLHCVSASLVQQLWPSSAFAPLSAAVQSEIPALSLSASSAFPALCSARFTGTLVSSASQLLNFSVVSDGGVRLWVDDYLVVDYGGNRTVVLTYPSFLQVPFTAGEPRPFRLEYSRWGSPGPATLQLWWSGNVTALQVVPEAAYAPTVSAFQAQRAALRDRLEAPAVPWQTYLFHNMGAHVLMPAGLALSATLALAGGPALGGISVYRNGNPAQVRPGLRSLNGSDYTLLTISQWAKAPNATVTLQSTVLGGDGLVLLAACAGSACSGLSLVVQPLMMAERAGAFTGSAANLTLSAALPGFAPVTVSALGAGCSSSSGSACSSAVPGAAADAPCLLLPLGAGSPVGYFASPSGALPPTLPAALAALGAAAQAAQAEQAAAFGAQLAPLWNGLASVLAWNSIFTPYEGVVTPVSRNWDIWGIGYILFEWDTYFLALLGSLQGGRAKDLAYASLIQVTLGRTVMGFVPNGAAGPRKTYDRSEPMVGARVTAAILQRWPADTWLLEGLLPVFVSWHDWAWEHRRGAGVFAAGSPDGLADLLVLGSEPNLPRSDTQNNLQAARYEGMDNSPLYDAPPAAFNASTHHMNMYDVGQTAYFASDAEATAALCSALGPGHPCAAALPRLAQRLARVQAAMNAHLWDPTDGVYYNALLNGTALRHFAPTNAMPLLSGTPSDAQAAALVAAIASPRGLCANASHTPAAQAQVLVQWRARSGHLSACLSQECTVAAVTAGLRVDSVQAVALLPAGGPGAGLLPLFLYAQQGQPGNTALVQGAAPPAPDFELVRAEGWCWEAPPPGPWPATPLSLWHSASAQAFKTCGSAACEGDSSPDWVAVRSPMCYAYNGTGADNTPCKVAGPSIARADGAFLDQAYWRGRAWAPHHMLLYWGLQRYEHLPAASSARQDLVALGQQVMLLNWQNFGQVCENVHGIIGTCEDSTNADPFYHWGALYGYTALLESGA